MPSHHLLTFVLALATLATVVSAKCPTDNTLCMNGQCYFCPNDQSIRFTHMQCYCDDTPCQRCPPGASAVDQIQFGKPFHITGACRWVAAYDKSNSTTAGVTTTVLCNGSPSETVVSGTCQCDGGGDCTGSPRLGTVPGSSGWNCGTATGRSAAAYALCCQSQSL